MLCRYADHPSNHLPDIRWGLRKDHRGKARLRLLHLGVKKQQFRIVKQKIVPLSIHELGKRRVPVSEKSRMPLQLARVPRRLWREPVWHRQPECR